MAESDLSGSSKFDSEPNFVDPSSGKNPAMSLKIKSLHHKLRFLKTFHEGTIHV